MLNRRRFLGRSLLACNALPLAGASSACSDSPAASDTADTIHKRALVFDAPVHALARIFYQGGRMGTRKSNGYWDLPRAREGGLGAFLLSVYVP
jgi:membrane dipeptidase